MNSGWIYCFVLKAGRRAVKAADVRFSAHNREAFSLRQVQQNRAGFIISEFTGLKSQADKSTKEKSIEMSEHKGTLLALDAPEP